MNRSRFSRHSLCYGLVASTCAKSSCYSFQKSWKMAVKIFVTFFVSIARRLSRYSIRRQRLRQFWQISQLVLQLSCRFWLFIHSTTLQISLVGTIGTLYAEVDFVLVARGCFFLAPSYFSPSTNSYVRWRWIKYFRKQKMPAWRNTKTHLFIQKAGAHKETLGVCLPLTLLEKLFRWAASLWFRSLKTQKKNSDRFHRQWKLKLNMFRRANWACEWKF